MLCPVPIPGHASTKQWASCVKGTNKVPGRNHPTVGQWLLHRYGGPKVVAADPMAGAGGLWIDGREFVSRLYANECENKLTLLASKNLNAAGYQLETYYGGRVNHDDARTWQPPYRKLDRDYDGCRPKQGHIPNRLRKKRFQELLELAPVDLILTSPPFGKNHNAGNTGINKDCVEKKNLHSAQAWGKDPRNIGNLKGWQLWKALLEIYGQMSSYLKKGGKALVILRNYIRDGSEVDDVGLHLSLFRMVGFKILGLHPRELSVTGHRAKYVYEMGMPYTDLEWVVVLEK